MKIRSSLVIKVLGVVAAVAVSVGLAIIAMEKFAPYRLALRDNIGCDTAHIQKIESCEDIGRRFSNEEERMRCYQGEAAKSQNACLCLNGASSFDISECYTFAVVAKNDPALCRFIRNGRDRGICYEHIASARNDVSVCEASPRRSQCISSLAVQDLDTSLCSKISVTSDRTDCQHAVDYAKTIQIEHPSQPVPVSVNSLNDPNRFLRDTETRTISGSFSEENIDEMGLLSRTLCFNIDAASFSKMPFRNTESGQRDFVCFDNQDEAKLALKIKDAVFDTDPSCASMSGKATLAISNYVVDNLPAEVFNKVHLEKVLKSEAPACQKK